LRLGIFLNILGVIPNPFQVIIKRTPAHIELLRDVFHHAVMSFGRDQKFVFRDLQRPVFLPSFFRGQKTPVHATRQELEKLLDKHRGVVLKVAAELSVSPRMLYYTFKNMGIDPNKIRKNPHKRG
jgi:hypothetical protein